MRRILRAALPLAIFLLLTVCLCSCTRAQTGSFTVVRGDEYSPYRTYGAAILPGFTITDGSLYQAVTAGGAAAAFDYQADEMTENGCFWYPQFQASVVIAVDRDKTDSAVSGWRDLAEIPDNVGLDDRVYLGEYLAAMTYGLTGELRDLSAACSLLRAVYASGRLDTSGAGRPVWICFDYEAAACAAQGRNIEIVVPAEGTLTFTSGIVSRSPLAGLSGFDLPSDAAVRPSARAGLFPDDSEYSRAAVLSDFTDIDRLLTNATRQYRRGVLRDKLFSSADGREHIILGDSLHVFRGGLAVERALPDRREADETYHLNRGRSRLRLGAAAHFQIPPDAVLGLVGCLLVRLLYLSARAAPALPAHGPYDCQAAV